jgi:hypothetical protein
VGFGYGQTEIGASTNDLTGSGTLGASFNAGLRFTLFRPVAASTTWTCAADTDAVPT